MSEAMEIDEPIPTAPKPGNESGMEDDEPVAVSTSDDRDGDAGADEDASDEATAPLKRGRGRPPGSTKKRAGSAAQVLPIPIDDSTGKPYKLDSDEMVLPEDKAGETKIDKNGHLLGARQFRVRTFTLPDRGEKLYMLSAEPARCVGLRDAYPLFQRHRKLYKVVMSDGDKADLISRELIPASYRGRIISVVTARSVFLEFGAQVIVGGKRVTDDYYEAAARKAAKRGEFVEDSLADPSDILPAPGQQYPTDRYAAWYHAESSRTETPGADTDANRGSSAMSMPKAIRNETWLLDHARAVSRFNHDLVTRRRNRLRKIATGLMAYAAPGSLPETRRAAIEPHTNVPFVLQATQPRRARWSRTPPAAEGEPVIFSTVLQVRGRSTGLSTVDPHVYTNCDEETKRAISLQLALESGSEV